MDELSLLRVPFPSAAGSTVQVLPLPVHLAWRVREWACRMMRLVRCGLAPLVAPVMIALPGIVSNA